MSNSFQQLRRAKGLTSREVANAAGVSLADEYLYEIGGIPADKEVGPKLMQAFEQLTGERNIVAEQPTILLNKLGGPYGVSKRQGSTSGKHQEYPDYD